MSHSDDCSGAPRRGADGSWFCATCGLTATLADVAIYAQRLLDRLDIDVYNLLGQPPCLEDWRVEDYDDGSLEVETGDDQWQPGDGCLRLLAEAGFRRLDVCYVGLDGNPTTNYHLDSGDVS